MTKSNHERMTLRQKNLSARSCALALNKVLLTILLLLPSVIYSQGDLLITPKRIVFEGNRRSMDINLSNIGQDSATYSISLIQVRMREDGGFETITEPDPGQRFADRFVRFFPRTVTLGPGEAQTIKVQLIRSNELTPGEYRSHFYFRAVPKPKPLGEEELPSDTTSISVKLIPIYGITIPVIIRSGASNTTVTLSDLLFDYDTRNNPRISMVFNRTGNMSVYGDIAVDYISPQGKATRVGVANGVAVYTPNAKRRFVLNLTIPEGTDLRTGKLKVTYSAPSDVKPEKYAEAELVLK
ncbi:MAG: molecular chaperone [Bacteroidales bacterium]|nr:molecular chaperone [Bacteroidales bacterium]